MELQIRKQLNDLTNQHGLDESFVDRILTAMETPLAVYEADVIAENETLLSTASALEKGILTVSSQIKDEAESLMAGKSKEEILSNTELFRKLKALKGQFDTLSACFWGTLKTRLEKEGIHDRHLGLRENYQIVALQPMDMDIPAVLANLLTSLGGIGGVVSVRLSDDVDRSEVPSEVLETCQCPDCLTELARRRDK